VSYSPNGQFVASAGYDQTIRLWRASDGSLLRVLTGGNQYAINTVAFSPDSTLIAASEDGYGNNVQIWRVSDGVLLKTLPGDLVGFSQSVAFAPDGKTLVSTSGYTHEIRFWDVATGALLKFYDSETGWGIFPTLPIKFQPQGNLFGYGRIDATVVTAVNPFAL
jgi:WD40 repeat protein